MTNSTKPTGTLIQTYMQGESVITVYEDGDYYVSYRDGNWCDTMLTPDAREDMYDHSRDEGREDVNGGDGLDD